MIMLAELTREMNLMDYVSQLVRKKYLKVKGLKFKVCMFVFDSLNTLTR